MSDEKHADENKHAQRDLKNPKDRDALKRAADDLLKTGKKEPQSDMQQEEEAEETADAGDPAVLAEENAALKDQMLRLAADMENLRRRTARDVADAKAYSVAGFARDMLSVSDDLARALAAIPEGTRDNDPGLKALAEGVEMTERSMMTALERHGVKKIEPEGQRFDPNFHQAIFEVPDASVPSNTVTQVMQAGYIIGDRVLRPAMVGVSKGGQKADAQADEKDGE